jgi:hypothetical protein
MYRLDARSGDVREMMRFADLPDDALFVRGNRVLVRIGSVVRVHDLEGNTLAWLVRSTAGRWGVATSEGLSDGIGGGPELFVWRSGTRTYAPSDLSPRFRVPGLLQRLMRGERVVPPPASWASAP